MDQPAPSSSSKVVDLASRSKKARQAPGSSLVEGLWSQSRQEVSAALDKAFAEIDDDLFKRSEVRQEVFDGLRELRKRQPLIVRLFLERLEEDFLQALHPAPSTATPQSRQDKPQGGGPSGFSASSLSLVEDAELEKTLAVSRMVSASESAHARELSALRARVAMMRGGMDAEKAPVPLAPESVAQAFSNALDSAPDLQIPERIVAYKHFERHVMGHLGVVYQGLNESLARAGVLPDYQPQMRVKHPDSQSSQSVGGLDSAMGEASQAPASPVEPPDHLGSLSGAAHPAPPQHAAPLGQVPAASSPAVSAADVPGLPASFPHVQLSAEEQAAWAQLRQALAHQRQVYSQPQTPAPTPAASMGDLSQALAALREIQSLLGELAQGEARQVSAPLKAQILEKLGQGTPEAKSLGDHEAAIDMVDLIFEHILGDPDLPAPMQAVLARLQVPFVKVAVHEPHLFAKRDHPARRLLDLMGEAGKGWDPKVDHDGALYGRIKQAVDEVHEKFLEDPAVFEREHRRLEEFVREISERASLTQKRAQEVAKARERLEHAQSLATQQVASRLNGKTLPEWARTMLLRHWVSFMVLLIQRKGEQSLELEQAQEFVAHVANAAQCKDAQSKKALAAQVPALVGQLRDGLAALGIPKDNLQKMTDGLKAYLDTHASPSPAPGASISPPPLPPAPSYSRPSALRKGPAPSPASLEAVGKLQVDDWVELVDDNGRRTRGKVSWISSFTRRVLLVTLAGTKIDERSQEDLARMLEADRLRILESKPLFDRAMGSIVGHIRGK